MAASVEEDAPLAMLSGPLAARITPSSVPIPVRDEGFAFELYLSVGRVLTVFRGDQAWA